MGPSRQLGTEADLEGTVVGRLVEALLEQPCEPAFRSVAWAMLKVSDPSAV